jgi:hypothetical protein
MDRITTAISGCHYQSDPSALRRADIWTGKVVQFVVHSRLSFHQAFAYAHSHLAGKTCCIANADIFFDTSLAHLNGDDALAGGLVWCRMGGGHFLQ